jgi:hypothetical protein
MLNTFKINREDYLTILRVYFNNQLINRKVNKNITDIENFETITKKIEIFFGKILKELNNNISFNDSNDINKNEDNLNKFISTFKNFDIFGKFFIGENLNFNKNAKEFKYISFDKESNKNDNNNNYESDLNIYMNFKKKEIEILEKNQDNNISIKIKNNKEKRNLVINKLRQICDFQVKKLNLNIIKSLI